MSKVLPFHKEPSPKKEKHTALSKAFFDPKGHLNQSGISLYVEARILDREDELPQKIIQHLGQCAKCQQEALDFYEFMREEDTSCLTPHPFLDRKNTLTGLQKIWSLTSSASRVAAVILLTVASCLGYLLVSEPYTRANSALNPPFTNPDINVTYQEWSIEASKNQSLLTPNGAYIHIPSSIFVDEQGVDIQGQITIKYRELRRASELIASGIPLGLEDAGQMQALENAGTFEIRGFQNGKTIYIKDGKSLSVNMSSDFTEEGFAHYYLDEQPTQVLTLSSPLASNAQADNAPQAKWIYQQKSKSFYSTNLAEQNKQRLASHKKLLDSLSKEIQLLENEDRQNTHHSNHQRLVEDNKPFFKLSFDAFENPKMLGQQDKIWEYVGKNKSISPTQDNQWVLNQKWESMQLTPQKYKDLSLKGHLGPVNDAQFSYDGTKILTASDDQTAKVWSHEAQYLFTLKGHKGAVNTAVFSPKNDAYILTSSDDQSAKIWSEKGNIITTLQGHNARVKSAVFSPDGNYILTCADDNTARLWNYRGQSLHSFSHLSTADDAKISPNNRMVLCISSDSTLQLWSIQGEKLAQIQGQFKSAKFSNDGRYILTTSAHPYHGQAKLWTTRGELLKSFNIHDKNIVFSPDDRHLMSVAGNKARLWYLNPKKSYNTVLIRNMYNQENDYRHAHTRQITYLEYAKQNGEDLILTASEDYTAKIWSSNGGLLHTLREHTGKINKISISASNDQILTASDDFTAKLWVEREIQDVFEMYLFKDSRLLQNEDGSTVKIKGKRFYTSVKEADINKLDDTWQSIETPQLHDNPLNGILQQYEKTLAEIKFLESQTPPKLQTLMRGFKVSQFGYYACQRLFRDTKAIECQSSFSFEKNIHTDKVKLYHITGGQETVIIPIRHEAGKATKLYFSANLPNKILAVLPNDRVAMFGKEKFSQINIHKLKHEKQLNFKLRPSFPVKNLEEFDTFLSRFGS